MQEVTVKYRKSQKKYKYDHKTTVKQLIDTVRADNKIENPNFSAKLIQPNDTEPDGKESTQSLKEIILNNKALIQSLNIKEGAYILVYADAAASDPPPKIKRICIPRRTDIDTEMKDPPDLEIRIQYLEELFPKGQAPDRETIKTALENSYWNLDRAVDYLFPPNPKPETTLSQDEKEKILELTKVGKGYPPETAIQVYFACEKNMENAINLIQTIELDQ